MKFLIVYNSLKPDADVIAEKSKEILESVGAKTELIEFNDFIGNTELNSVFSGVKAVIVIGGDGTIIKTAKIAAINNLAVLGINAGRIGYLADDLEFGVEDVKKIAELESFKIKGLFSKKKETEETK